MHDPSTSTASLPRKERERLARRQAIMAAAQEVFADKGFDRATLEEIAERAEFGKGTIYNYFRDKQDLFIQQLEQGIEEYRGLANAAVSTGGTARDRVMWFVRHALASCVERRAFYRVLILESGRVMLHLDGARCADLFARYDALIQDVARVIDSGIAAGELRPVDSARAAANILHLCEGIMRSHVVRNLDGIADETVRMVGIMVFEGLAVRPAGEGTGS